jgi:hypothetical protein
MISLIQGRLSCVETGYSGMVPYYSKYDKHAACEYDPHEAMASQQWVLRLSRDQPEAGCRIKPIIATRQACNIGLTNDSA